jgi:hypothetical protein
LTQFDREQIARRQHRHELASAQHERAVAFMRELTGSVVALRDGFAKEDCARVAAKDARAAAIRERLDAYAMDRRNGSHIWNGRLHAKRVVAQNAVVGQTPASNRPAAAAPAVHAKPIAPATSPTKTDEPPAATARPHEQPAHQSGHQTSSLGGSSERRGGESK